MPRRPDVPCSGGCGKLLWRGTGSLAPDEMMCRPCRKTGARRGQDTHSPDREAKAVRGQCASCRKVEPLVWFDRYCSRQCSHEAQAWRYRTNTTCPLRILDCVDCGSAFVSRNGQRRCAAHRSGPSRKKRARQFTEREIFDRDRWRCGLCAKPIDPTLSYPDRMCASLDHVVPLSRGGSHTRANVQASHLGCNCAKGNGVVRPEQLRLIG